MAKLHGTCHSSLHINPIALTFSLFTPPPPPISGCHGDRQLAPFGSQLLSLRLLSGTSRLQTHPRRQGAAEQSPRRCNFTDSRNHGAEERVPGLTEINAGDVRRARAAEPTLRSPPAYPASC